MKYSEFAARFREACKEADAPETQEKLGKFLGVSGAMAWYYRNGEKLPGMNTAIHIAMKLSVCVEWLLTGRGPKRPSDILPSAEIMGYRLSEHSTPSNRKPKKRKTG